MLNKKHIITILIGLAVIVVFYLSFINGNHPHGKDIPKWIQEHGAVVKRNKNANSFCLPCHGKHGQTKENFCNKCHQQNKVKLIK